MSKTYNAIEGIIFVILWKQHSHDGGVVLHLPVRFFVKYFSFLTSVNWHGIYHNTKGL